jgi:acyl-homoserine lactone acylase PvdQ
MFTYQVTPIFASGVTSLNPDVLDLYVEEIRADTFLSSDGGWKPMHIIEEKIKVRFGFEVDFQIKFTDNGVVLPRELLEGKAQQLNWFLVKQLWEQNEEFYS